MYRKWLKDIRFWIVIFFVIRLIGITNPPIETTHSWRQVSGLMVSRNFYEVDNNIFYPRLDNAGELSGITATEFPLLNYIHYIFAEAFGWQHWYGRLINLIVSSIGIWFFYRILNKYISLKTAFFAAITLIVSSWFIYSRKTMPDTFSTSLVIISLWYALQYFNIGKWRNLFLFTVFATAGILCKIPAGYLMVVLLIPFFSKKYLIQSKIYFALSSVIILATVAIWYFYWNPYLIDKYGFAYYFLGDPFLKGFREIISHPLATLHKFYFVSLHTVGFILFISGLIWAIYKKEKLILLVFILCFSTFCIFIIKASWAFHSHDYYILPFIPAMALPVGYLLASIQKKWLVNILFISLIVDGIITQYNDFFIKKEKMYLTELELIADNVSSKNDLIGISGVNYPTQLYMAHRKGWILDYQQITNPDFISEITKKGAKYLFINRKEFDENLSYPLIYEDENFKIYRITKNFRSFPI